MDDDKDVMDSQKSGTSDAGESTDRDGSSSGECVRSHRWMDDTTCCGSARDRGSPLQPLRRELYVLNYPYAHVQ